MKKEIETACLFKITRVRVCVIGGKDGNRIDSIELTCGVRDCHLRPVEEETGKVWEVDIFDRTIKDNNKAHIESQRADSLEEAILSCL